MNESNFEIIGLMQLFGYIGNEWACCMCFRGRKSEHATWWVGVVMQSDCVSVCVCMCVVLAPQPQGASQQLRPGEIQRSVAHVYNIKRSHCVLCCAPY